MDAIPRRGQTASKRPWVVEAAWRRVGFYGGNAGQIEVGVTLKLNTYVAARLEAKRNDVTLPEDSSTRKILTVRPITTSPPTSRGPT